MEQPRSRFPATALCRSRSFKVSGVSSFVLRFVYPGSWFCFDVRIDVSFDVRIDCEVQFRGSDQSPGAVRGFGLQRLRFEVQFPAKPPADVRGKVSSFQGVHSALGSSYGSVSMVLIQ